MTPPLKPFHEPFCPVQVAQADHGLGLVGVETPRRRLGQADAVGEIGGAGQAGLGRLQVPGGQFREPQDAVQENGDVGVPGRGGDRQAFLGCRPGSVEASQLGVDERSREEDHNPPRAMLDLLAGLPALRRVALGRLPVAGPAFQVGHVSQQVGQRAVITFLPGSLQRYAQAGGGPHRSDRREPGTGRPTSPRVPQPAMACLPAQDPWPCHRAQGSGLAPP